MPHTSDDLMVGMMPMTVIETCELTEKVESNAMALSASELSTPTPPDCFVTNSCMSNDCCSSPVSGAGG